MRATQRGHQGQTPQGPDHQGLKPSVISPSQQDLGKARQTPARAEAVPINIY